MSLSILRERERRRRTTRLVTYFSQTSFFFACGSARSKANWLPICSSCCHTTYGVFEDTEIGYNFIAKHRFNVVLFGYVFVDQRKSYLFCESIEGLDASRSCSGRFWSVLDRNVINVFKMCRRFMKSYAYVWFRHTCCQPMDKYFVAWLSTGIMLGAVYLIAKNKAFI